MSNGEVKYLYTTDEKAVLLDQLGKVMKYITEGQRPPEYISRALQGIIGNDYIYPRKRVVRYVHEIHSKAYLVVSDACGTLMKAASTGSYDGVRYRDQILREPLLDSAQILLTPLRPVDEYVRLIKLDKMYSTRWLIENLPLADPAAFVAFCNLFPQEARGLGRERLTTLWPDPDGERTWVFSAQNVYGGDTVKYVLDVKVSGVGKDDRSYGGCHLLLSVPQVQVQERIRDI